jgi:hypothetical protein
MQSEELCMIGTKQSSFPRFLFIRILCVSIKFYLRLISVYWCFSYLCNLIFKLYSHWILDVNAILRSCLSCYFFAHNRFLKGNKATTGDNDSFHVDEEERHRLHGSTKKKSVPLISGTAYCISSCSMIMLNKIVLSSYDFNAGISLMFYQVS